MNFKKNVYRISNYFLTQCLPAREALGSNITLKCSDYKIMALITFHSFNLAYNLVGYVNLVGPVKTVKLQKAQDRSSFNLAGFHWILLDPTGFYQILLDFTCKKIHIINMGISSFESFNDWRCDFSSKSSEIVSSGQITNSSAIIMKNRVSVQGVESLWGK